MNQNDLFGPRIVPMESMDDLVVASQIPCESCGGTRALLPHRIDKSKLGVLRDMAIYSRVDSWVRVEAGRGLRGSDTGKWKSTMYRAEQHAARLKWFGLLEHGSEPRVPSYRVTLNGLNFLRGRITVPQKILCREGVVMYVSQERVHISSEKETFDKAYWDSYPWSDACALIGSWQ